MKYCPFCKELIKDDAIKCRFCGEFLTSSEIPQPEKARKDKTEVNSAKKGISRFTLSLLFSAIGLIAAPILMPFNSPQQKTFPIKPIFFAVLSIVSISWSIKNIKKKNIFSGIVALSIPFLLISLTNFSDRYNVYKKYLISEKAAKAEIQYNQEHKEEYYQKALALMNEDSFSEAKALLDKIISVDKDYKDTEALIASTKKSIEKKAKDKLIAEAQNKIIEAARLSKSNKCEEIEKAIENYRFALKHLSDTKNAADLLLNTQLNKLQCYEGNSNIKMSIQIFEYQPLTLIVWIKNVSDKVRHANPNNFTLVTIAGQSFSVSTKTYSLGRCFDAVDLQPGTETSGAIIFDTYDKPKKLVYSELLGTTIERAFPF